MDARGGHRFYVVMLIAGLVVMIGSLVEATEGGAVRIFFAAGLFIASAGNVAVAITRLRAKR